jgi:hypothetical protein
MNSKKSRVRYELNSGVVKYLTDEGIRSILRAADELIAIGGTEACRPKFSKAPRILLLLKKIRRTGNARLIPLLKAWKEIEYKKVQDEVQRAINYLLKEGII